MIGAMRLSTDSWHYRTELLDIDRSLCNYCGACVGMCPTDAIWMDDTIIEVNDSRCIRCSFCVRGCPTGGAIAGRW